MGMQAHSELSFEQMEAIETVKEKLATTEVAEVVTAEAATEVVAEVATTDNVEDTKTE